MCTVAELITKLQTLPQEAIVEVMVEYQGSYYTGTEFKAVDLDYTSDLDKNSILYGKIFVQLKGE